MSLHRACCCGEPDNCCNVWCECPDEICVTSGTWYRTVTMYSCDNDSNDPNDCPIADGTVIGESTHTTRITGVKFRKVTNSVNPDGSCSGCCKYTYVDGEEQTGRMITTANSWFVNCLDKEEEGDCTIGNRTCAGTADVPLDNLGTGLNGYFSYLRGSLYTRCCNTGQCEDQNIQAVLSITAEGRKAAGSDSDCCSQTSTQPVIGASLGVGGIWDCRHRSQWVGTCPEDLMQEPMTDTSGLGYMDGCLTFLNLGQICPCPSGPPSDYTSPCFDGVTVIGSLGYCLTVSEGVTLPSGSNGLKFLIHACT